MSRRILVIDGHPDPDGNRLVHALAGAYVAGARAAGHELRRLDLANLDFPILRSPAEFEKGEAPAAVVEAQEAIDWAEHLVLLYPLWLGSMPALLKAFLEQVMRPGFAFDRTGEEGRGWPRKRLTGRTARIVVTMGMPAFVYRWFFGAHGLKSLERSILSFCGIKPSGETLLGGVGSASVERRARWLAKLEELGRKGA